MSYFNEVESFKNALPYLLPPYNKRNWGGEWHSLCSYHGKLKPSIAYHLISQFTNGGDIVLDPMSGVGTIPLEACNQGRIGIANDLNPLAYVVSMAKVKQPSKKSTLNIVKKLETYISNHTVDEFNLHKYDDFGLNGKLPTYFHEDTYKEILLARKFFLDDFNRISPSRAVAFSAFLHVLHGNRPYALSRNSHPLTPYAPSGEFVYKSVVEHIRKKIDRVYSVERAEQFKAGKAFHKDLFNLTKKQSGYVDAIITSPPFLDSIKFYNQNWMRLWLSGWEPDDFKNNTSDFIETKQKVDFDIYIDMLDKFYKLLKPKGRVIFHLGKTDKFSMADKLALRVDVNKYTIIGAMSEDTSNLEKHGIKDKGTTVEHEFLFLEKREVGD